MIYSILKSRYNRFPRPSHSFTFASFRSVRLRKRTPGDNSCRSSAQMKEHLLLCGLFQPYRNIKTSPERVVVPRTYSPTSGRRSSTGIQPSFMCLRISRIFLMLKFSRYHLRNAYSQVVPFLQESSLIPCQSSSFPKFTSQNFKLYTIV